MTAQPLYFGGELDAFLPSDSTVIETTAANTYDSAYSRCSIQTRPGQNFKTVQFAAQTGALYFNFCINYGPQNGGENDLFYGLNDSGAVMFKMTGNRTSFTTFLAKMYYYNGSGFTAIGSGASVALGATQYFTLYVNRLTGVATMYVGGTQQDTGTAGAFASVNNFAQAEHLCGGGLESAYWSQCFASTSPTVGQRLYTIVEDTNGAAQDWTGAVTDVNELVINDATGITSTTNGNVSTYSKSGLSLSGVVLGVGTSARFNVGATGPQHLQNVLRVSGTNYTSPSALGVTGFAPAQYMWMTNPATSTAWTPGGASAVEWGVKAIT